VPASSPLEPSHLEFLLQSLPPPTPSEISAHYAHPQSSSLQLDPQSLEQPRPEVLQLLQLQLLQRQQQQAQQQQQLVNSLLMQVLQHQTAQQVGQTSSNTADLLAMLQQQQQQSALASLSHAALRVRE